MYYFTCCDKKIIILELVTRIALFKEKINSDELANHIMKTIMIRLSLCLSDWQSVQLDKASTHKSAIKNIVNEFEEAPPSLSFCCSYSLNNTRKKLLLPSHIFKSSENTFKVLSSVSIFESF